MSTPAQFADSLNVIREEEVDVVSIAPEGSPLYAVFTMPARKQVNGSYDQMGFREKVWSKDHKWIGKEVDENTKVFTLDGAIADGVDTTWTLDSTDGLIANAILNVPSTGEQVKVASVDSATAITVVRGYGTVSAAAIADNAALYFVSTSVPTGTASVGAVAVAATEVDNEIQKIVTTVTSTDYEDFLNRYSAAEGTEVGSFMSHSMREHAKRIELAMLVGQKKYDSTNKQGTMEGVYELAKRSGNVSDLSGGLTKANLIAALRPCFRYGVNTQVRYAFCGADALDKIALLFDANLIKNDSVENTSYKFSKLELPGGEEVRFIRHPFMTTDLGLNKKVIVLSPEEISVVYAAGKSVSGASVSGKTRVIPNVANSTYASTVIDIALS